MKNDSLMLIAKILAKHRIHSDKITEINIDCGINLEVMDIDILNDVMDFVGAPQDNSDVFEPDDPDFTCNDWIIEGFNQYGSNEKAIYDFLNELIKEFK